MLFRSRNLILLLVAILLGVGLLFLMRESTSERPEPAMPKAEQRNSAEKLRSIGDEHRRAISAPNVAPDLAPSPSEGGKLETAAAVERPEAGVLEVCVVHETVGESLASLPVSGGTVRLALSKDVYRSGAPPLLEEEDVVSERALDAQGEVRFDNLAAGNWYVEARTPSGASRATLVKLVEEEGRRLVLRFGAGRVHGVVSDAETLEPIENAIVKLSIDETPRGGFGYEVQRELGEAGRMPSAHHMKTGADGVFRFDELPAGRASLQLDPSAYDPETSTYTFVPRRFVKFELAPGETRRFDFPDTAGAVWTGQVRTAHGEIVTGLDSKRGKLDVRMREPGSYRQVQAIDPSGSFRVYLPAGVHDVVLTTPFNDEELRPLGEDGLTLEAGVEVNRDLILPGTRLVGTVLDSAAEPLRGRWQYPVGAHLKGETHSLAWFSTFLREDGTFVLDGLGPGEWVVGAGRLGASTSLTVLESDLELPVVVTLP